MVEMAGVQTNKIPRMVFLPVKFIYFLIFELQQCTNHVGNKYTWYFTTDNVKQSNCSV